MKNCLFSAIFLLLKTLAVPQHGVVGSYNTYDMTYLINLTTNHE